MNKVFYAFGTQNQIHTDENISETLMNEIIQTAYKLDDLFSVFKKESEISRINENAGIKKVKVSKVTADLLLKAAEFSEITDGAFDITIRPAVREWSIGHDDQKIPSQKELDKIKKLVNYKRLHIDSKESTVYLEEKGQAIDLGGIAKGYASDLIKKILIEEGMQSGMLNFGGTIATIGTKPDGTAWRVGIQNPLAQRGQSIGNVELNHGSLVTSAVNERFFVKDGMLYHHLIDPRTLKPADSRVLGVTASGTCARDLDALTTAFFIMGVNNGIELANNLGVEALFLLNNGTMYATKGFELEKTGQNKI